MRATEAGKSLAAPWSAAAAAGELDKACWLAVFAGKSVPGLASHAATFYAWYWPAALLLCPLMHLPGPLPAAPRPAAPCRPEPRDTSWQHKPMKSVRSMGHSVGPSGHHLHRTSAAIAATMAAPGSDFGASGGGEHFNGGSPGESVRSGVAGAAGSAAGADMAPATMLLARTYSGPALSSAGKKSQRHSVLQRISYATSGGDSSYHGGGAFAAAMAAEEAGDYGDGAPGSPYAPATQA